MNVMAEEKPGTRSYSSNLREHQKETTRNLIMEAVASLVSEGRIHIFSVRDVADCAGISYASVYRHFKTREALLEELYEWASELFQSRLPAAPNTIDEIPTWIEKSLPLFEQYAEINQAIVTTLAALNINPESRQRRDNIFYQLVTECAPHLPPEVARRTAAVIRYLASNQGWATLRQRFGLDAADTAAALNWALQVLIRDLKQYDKAQGKDL